SFFVLFVPFLWLRLFVAGAPTIDRNSNNDNRPDNDFLNVVGPTNLLASIPKKRHDQRADHRSENAALAAIQTPATNYHRRNDVQLRSGGNSRITLSQTGHLHHAGKSKQQARQTVDPNLQPVRGNAARTRCSFIRPKRKN